MSTVKQFSEDEKEYQRYRHARDQRRYSDTVHAERDRAFKERDEVKQERDEVRQERDEVRQERDAANAQIENLRQLLREKGVDLE